MGTIKLAELQNQNGEESTEDIKGKTTREKIEKTKTEEIIIGVCSPIGSRKQEVIDEIKKTLENKYKYDVQIIKISDFIKNKYEASLDIEPDRTPAFTELSQKIKTGNTLRNEYHRSLFADLAIFEINKGRVDPASLDEGLEKNVKSRRVCYIIDSIKNKEELLLLRDVYRELFYCFSIFSPKEEREVVLTDKGLSKHEIRELINKDDFENNESGQNVRNTFVEADFFIRASIDNPVSLKERIERFFDLIFETQIITPYKEEIAMYQAKSAANNSACLSRQVGATITDVQGNIISKGWNDVPKYGGNLYTIEEKNDQRCFGLGYCSNDRKKNEISQNVIEIIKDYISNHGKSDLDSEIYNGIVEKIRKSSKLKDLIEFSRSVHAEMHAIIQGSQLSGSKMVGGSLFCTTYPCHNCARHIVVAGIEKIYYIEPYVKSLCIDLHSDAITENEKEIGKVKILMYEGVAPRRYLEFFSMKENRKDANGQINKTKPKLSKPKTTMTLHALHTLEAQSLHILKESGYIDTSNP